MPDQDQPPQHGTSGVDSGRAALDTALADYRAWTSHDFERAMTFITEDIVCQTPAGMLEGAGAPRGCDGLTLKTPTPETASGRPRPAARQRQGVRRRAR